MKSYQLARFIVFCSVLTLAGCQSPNNGAATHNPKALPMPIASQLPDPQIIQARKLQWADGYHWQLVEARDRQGQPITMSTADPINLKIDPSALMLSQSCHSYRLDFYQGDLPFPYASAQLSKEPTSCNKIDQTHTSDIPTLIAGRYFDFNLEPIAPRASAKRQANASQRLSLKIENGNTLIFKGTPKALSTPSSLTINNELLERYHWRLVNAVSYDYDNQGKLISKKLIGDFYHPDFPISLDFFSNADYQTISFSANCNGIGAPYILTQDYQLKVGVAIQTMMGCGATGNRIESHLYKLLSQSQSQLQLTSQPKASTTTADVPRYNLLQTMKSGETLLWQNEEKLKG